MDRQTSDCVNCGQPVVFVFGLGWIHDLYGRAGGAVCDRPEPVRP